VTRAPYFDAVYLHARAPADARVAFLSEAGPDDLEAHLPAELRALCEPVEFELLVPTEESSLRPVTPHRLAAKGDGGQRVVPGLWRTHGLALRLEHALPHLCAREIDLRSPGLCYLIQAARLVQALLDRRAFAPTSGNSVLAHVPYWEEDTVRCLGAVAELAPGILRTARFATQDHPVHTVTARNLTFSFVGHALDACRGDRAPAHESADRVPTDFHRVRPEPVLQVLAPRDELEDGVPWGIQLAFRPVHGLDLTYSLEELKERLAQDLFPDALARQAIDELEDHLDEIARRVPALHRAMNMDDGKASLNREELDQVLDHLTLLENEGFAITLPGLESMQRLSARVSLAESASSDGPRPWFEFRWSLAVAGQELDQKEFDALVNARSPLVFLDRGPVLLTPKDREALQAFKKRGADEGERISFFEALRLKLGGATHLHGLAMETLDGGPRLDELVRNLENARSVEERPLPAGFIGELRPYQSRGQAWLYFLLDQGFGACLADDMGLGKTIQAITVILDWRIQRPDAGPILLVCPVSVLGNWRRELQRFSPELKVALHHGKFRPREPEAFAAMTEEHAIVLTSFNLLQRDQDLLLSRVWDGVVLDEAQNIKNPATRQSKAARSLRGKFRIALTGTPLENRPLDLWSIMDFLNEGLLGTRTQFMQTLEHPIVKQRSRSRASTLGRLVRPFVLRRLKTDPEIITDLPEKSEQVVAANLSREQGVLYEAVVRKGLQEVEKAGEGMQRRGAILTTLLRLKQVCNHPAHYLSDGSTLAGRSGKLELLTEMMEEALEEGDRCLIFTQFREMGGLLKTHLEEVFKNKVLFLHGGVPQKDREDMVATFQAEEPDGPKIFVLSLKAGGTGLNLTAANRVFHFDRWWNPAVEDQATDRAFRIGQQRNVFVHKFVCIGTLEERIQTMLERKRDVANTLLGAGESWLTELTNDELKRLLVLDRKEALA
jgi:SNF2 family DNA or RNA helicase